MDTTPTSPGADGEDRLVATAQQIMKSLSLNTQAREDMLLILSSFDKRLSNISTGVRFDAAEKLILRWDSSPSTHHPLPWEDSPDEAAEYLSAVDDILQLVAEMSIRSENEITDRSDKEIMDRAETAIQIAMSRLEDEFRLILIRNTVLLDAETIRKGSLFVTMKNEESDSEGDDLGVELINGDAVIELKEIADRMMRSGYEKECVEAFTSVRRDALDESLMILGVEKISMEQVQKIEWSALDEKMKKWVEAFKITVRVLLPGEKRLCYQIFNGAEYESDKIRETCFNETTKGIIMQLLNFGEAVAIGQKSPEKLFRVLDMYDALAADTMQMMLMVTDEVVINEVKWVLDLLGDAVKLTFVEFENAVKEEASKKPMQNGEIHPLTRYVMNYMKLIGDYSETLISLLESDDDHENEPSFAKRLLLLMSSLESNLEEKSKLYQDGALHAIFLINNIHYIVKKVKESELGRLLGDDWVRTRRGWIRQYETSYLRACWTKTLHCLKDEGIGFRSRSSRDDASMAVVLKERFKKFNACFEEIYRAQTAWKVHDSQLREELRITISEKVIPAYRSFMGRFWRQLQSGKRAAKYIKYAPEDLENYLLDLFEGSRKST
ncbi:Exocyst complex protein Exo70 [Corchorus capsularis]|uniref:Exocyst subunit Exo70 family protein n=1 Tax=Corchorus capsularis TaxID=210143 RepID=A0A1R3I2T9_COCAP|nr:Exocyst complex protein Exo70 [Corchorus capsularis]